MQDITLKYAMMHVKGTVDTQRTHRIISGHWEDPHRTRVADQIMTAGSKHEIGS